MYGAADGRARERAGQEGVRGPAGGGGCWHERWRTRARGGREGRWVANDEHGEIQLRSTYVSRFGGEEREEDGLGHRGSGVWVASLTVRTEGVQNNAHKM